MGRMGVKRLSGLDRGMPVCNGIFSIRPVHQADNKQEGVMVVDDEFKQHSDRQAAAIRQRDYDDLQDEQSGRDTGRMKRFGVAQAEAADIKRQKDADLRHQLTALEQLLQDDPDYAALYKETMDVLTSAESLADQAIDKAKAGLAGAENDLRDIQNHANRLADGTRIYKDADGTVWSEDGRILPADSLDGVVWKKDAPSREDYVKSRKAIDTAKQRILDVEAYIYTVLGPARDRFTDPDNPPSGDDIRTIQKDILDGRIALQLSQSQDSATPETAVNTAAIKLPDLGC